MAHQGGDGGVDFLPGDLRDERREDESDHTKLQVRQERSSPLVVCSSHYDARDDDQREHSSLVEPSVDDMKGQRIVAIHGQDGATHRAADVGGIDKDPDAHRRRVHEGPLDYPTRPVRNGRRIVG